MSLLIDADEWISIGDAVEIKDRTIYPVAKVSIQSCGKSIIACRMNPLAMLISEGGKAYAISLTDEEITLDRLLEIAPYLKETCPLD